MNPRPFGPPPRRKTVGERLMSARARIGALLFVPVCLLGAAEAQAAAVCSNTPGVNDRVLCQESDATVIDIELTNPAIATTVSNQHGVYARHTNTGTGNIDVEVTGGSLSATGSGGQGVFALQDGAGGISIVLKGGVEVTSDSHGVHGLIQNTASAATITIQATAGTVSVPGGTGVRARHQGTGGIEIDLANVAVSTKGRGVYGRHDGRGGTAGVDIDVNGGSIETEDNAAYGVGGDIRRDSGGTVSIDVTDVAVTTKGMTAHGVYGLVRNTVGEAVTVSVTRGSLSTAGRLAHGIIGQVWGSASTASLSIDATDVTIDATGDLSAGVYATHSGTGKIDIGLNGVDFTGTGLSSSGVYANRFGTGEIDIELEDGSISTTNLRSHAVFGWVREGASGGVEIELKEGVVLSTTGDEAYGVLGYTDGGAAISIDVTGSLRIETAGTRSHGVAAANVTASSGAAVSLDVAGGSVTTAGLSAIGLVGEHLGLGSVSMTTRAANVIAAPFAIGMQAWAVNDASAAGRLVVTHGGAVQAREVGVLAWAARSSGHTMGAGAQWADDAARTAPMIHVTSSGEVTVGASVTDAFIRSRIAGADETLSTAEQPVLDAILAGSPGELATALAALPAAYDDAWKDEARNLLTKRAAAPTGDTARAHAAAEEILGLAHAGIRASALYHTAIADYIRGSDALSAAERTVLEAVLTGSGVEAALNAISGADYTTAWKDGVRQRAATYNAGDIRVDVTGGSIAAEGNGVEAFYAVPHDGNGAIAVTVAEGASVTGGANGIYVRNAGTGSRRAQSVRVDGTVRGGSGAGVRLVGGGRITVGATGEVGATSGVGVLADGDLKVVLEQTDGGVGRVTGRIEETGGDGDPEVCVQVADAATEMRVTGALGTKGSAPAGAFDVGIVADGDGVRVESGHAPRARVYEALPSVLLGLNRLPGFRDRMSAPRSAGGAGWARVEASRDKWRAAESTSASRLEYTHRRYGLSAGADVAMDERTLLGGSVHHRRGKAKVKGGGELDVSGRGVGVSGTWGLAGSGAAMAYVDAQAEATWYEADFRSSLRGGLKTGVSGRGNALGVEAGRRFETGGMALTPRVGLTHSKVSMEDFTDAVGSRVSVEDGRSLRGRAGMAVEMTHAGRGASGRRMFGSLDVEHEFSPDTKAVVSGTDLKAGAKATWLRLSVNGAHAWGEDGRYAVEGRVSYATNGGSHDLGGGVSLSLRF